MISRTVKNNIRILEKNTELVKTLQSTGKMSPKAAKMLILENNRKIEKYLEKLPAHEREFYFIKREFGNEFVA